MFCVLGLFLINLILEYKVDIFQMVKYQDASNFRLKRVYKKDQHRTEGH